MHGKLYSERITAGYCHQYFIIGTTKYVPVLTADMCWSANTQIALSQFFHM
jgi:hypothetical protein